MWILPPGQKIFLTHGRGSFFQVTNKTKYGYIIDSIRSRIVLI